MGDNPLFRVGTDVELPAGGMRLHEESAIGGSAAVFGDNDPQAIKGGNEAL
jgi:hypothetical protein